MSISEDEFFEALEKKDPASLNALRTFLAKTEALESMRISGAA